MSAWDELRRLGAFGEEATLELYRCVRAVARAGNYPPPAGHPSWTLDAVQETAHDVFADARGPQRLVELAVKAVDDHSFRRLLEQVVRNFLRDQARATAKGKLIRRLRELLDQDARFAAVGAKRPGAGNIELTDGTTPDVWSGRLSDLEAAAFKVNDVAVVRWRPQARRDSPLSDATSLMAVSEAVLRTAGGSVSLPDLADVVASRFAAGRAPVVTPVDDIEQWSTRSFDGDDPATDVDIRHAAERLVVQLTPRERLVLAYLDEPVRQLADRIGLGKSATAEIAARVRQIVGQVLGAEPQRDEIFAYARALVTPRPAAESSDDR
jgi:hypothetical protein